MTRLDPESYFADGAVFPFVTRNADLFGRIIAAFLANLATT